MLHSTAEIDIKTHCKVVFELLTRPTARLKWQKNLTRAVLLEGEVGKATAVTALAFHAKEGQQRVIETVLNADPRRCIEVKQTIGEDTYRHHYIFSIPRPGYLRITLHSSLKAGSTLGIMRGLFSQRLKSESILQLESLNQYIVERNNKRKIIRAKRKAVLATNNCVS